MPNYIKNKIELFGDQDQINELLAKFSTTYPDEINTTYDGRQIFKNGNESGWYSQESTLFERRDKGSVLGIPEGFLPDINKSWTRFPDFEKVVPCPQSIKDVGEINLSVVDAVKKKYNTPLSDNFLLASLEQVNRAKNVLKPEDQMCFERACKAFEETGYIYWYDFNLANWGTKWNASDCEQIDENTFVFTTAWSGVPELIQKISEQFPLVTISYKWADEDTSYNTGRSLLKEGMIKTIKPTGGTIEAYELYFELHPEDKANYELVDSNYKYIDND